MLLDPAALAAAPREVGLAGPGGGADGGRRPGLSPAIRVAGAAFRPDRRRQLWAPAPPCMAVTFAPQAAGQRFCAASAAGSAGKPKENREFRPARPEAQCHAVLREAPKTLNVLMAGNALKPSYLCKGGRCPARPGLSEEGRPLNNLRNLALWIVIALLLVFLFNLFQGTGHAHRRPADQLFQVQRAGGPEPGQESHLPGRP